MPNIKQPLNRFNLFLARHSPQRAVAAAHALPCCAGGRAEPPRPQALAYGKAWSKSPGTHRAAVQGTQQAPVTWLEAFVQQWVFKVQWQC